MKKAKKALLLILCAILLVVGSVMGTLAYLQVQTKEVKNTFTVGKVSLGDVDANGIATNGLDEADVDEYGQVLYKTNVDGVYDTIGTERAPRVLENTYKLIPGHTYVKDPTIHIAAGSEECWLFVEVNNEIENIEDKTPYGNTIAAQMNANGWERLSGNLYFKAADATTNGAANHIVFSEFTIAKDADVSTYEDAEISVIAYAVQKDNFTTAQAAWNATFGATSNG